jgi:SAM-dependent methyltransferase
MLNREEKRELRSDLFRHLDGIAVAPTVFTLHEKGVLEFLQKEKKATLKDICSKFNANEGYMNVALRILSSQGWLIQELDNKSDTISYSTNDKSAEAFSIAHIYKDVDHLLKFSAKYPKRKFHSEPFKVLSNIMERYKDNYDLNPTDTSSVTYQVLKHIEGIIVGPTVVQLGMSGMFHKYFMESSFSADEFHKDPESFEKLLDFFVWLGWYNKKNSNYSFTDKGLFFAQRASAYGVTVSYIPTFRNLDKLIFGDAKAHRDVKVGETEKHVDREMNVWGSGGAHASYFKKMDEVIIDIFNQDIDKQPKGILDMGCGNGAFLIHAFETVATRTKRGQMLEEHPLFLVGADFNKAAIKVSRANLIQADVWAKLMWGDIGNPSRLSDDLKENYNIALDELLNVRTFLDHNRIWSDPTHKDDHRVSQSTGAFAHRGDRINNNLVEDNLLEHFNKWMPYVKRHGLLLIELHSVDPALVAQNIGRTAATAYDGTHGFSDQYIVELGIFKKIAEEAGLAAVDKYASRFPDSDLATVSINLLRG